ncbi:MAG: cysteine synthase family protein [Actinomycetota bacterium]
MTDWDAAAAPAASMLDAIGRTPLVSLSKIAPPGHELFAKIEWYGPTGSVKDRIYRWMIERAEQRGALLPGMALLECSTGNAGIACSMVAAIKGYPCTIVMPRGMSEERKKLIRAFGADLVLTPGAGSDIELALARMEEIRADDPNHWFVPAEFENPDNVQAHRLTSAIELWEQTGDGGIDAIVAAQGTGGWISGVGRHFKQYRPEVRIYVVEPEECALISRRVWGTHGIAGIGDGIVPPNLDLSIVDGVVTVRTAAAVATAQRLAREEGVLAGTSGGCNVHACLTVAAAHPELARIATLIPDTAMRYYSTGLFGEEESVDVPDRDHVLDERTVAELDRHAARLEVLG